MSNIVLHYELLRKTKIVHVKNEYVDNFIRLVFVIFMMGLNYALRNYAKNQNTCQIKYHIS